MKKNIIIILMTIILGITFTFFYLNKTQAYAQEERLVYAFQTAAFEKLDSAEDYAKQLPSSIIIKEDNLYKIYTAIYKDNDLINKMVVFFEDNQIGIYLKTIPVSTGFYVNLSNYETLLNNTTDESVYNKINQSILNLYKDSLENA